MESSGRIKIFSKEGEDPLFLFFDKRQGDIPGKVFRFQTVLLQQSRAAASGTNSAHGGVQAEYGMSAGNQLIVVGGGGQLLLGIVGSVEGERCGAGHLQPVSAGIAGEDHFVTSPMAAVFLGTEIVHRKALHSIGKMPVPAGTAFVDIAFVWPVSAVFHLLKPIGKEHAQSKAGQERQIFIAASVYPQGNPALSVDSPTGVKPYAGFYNQRTDRSGNTYLHNILQPLGLTLIDPGITPVISSRQPVLNQIPFIIVNGSAPDIILHSFIQKFAAVSFQLIKAAGELVKGIAEILSGDNGGQILIL